jgi:aminopeptidase N
MIFYLFRDIDGFVVTTFQTTPLMQTYILGFTISKFDSIADLSTDIPHRVYARPATIKSGNALFGLNTGLQILQKHEELFDMKYQLPKLDQVAIPDFYFNAMENWGLVTYREEIVLINSTHSPLRQKQRSATVISHELSHMYFGNLVSPKWWQYLWMKEGFATFFEFYTASLIYPEWRLMELFVVDKLQNVFTSDSYATTRAMTYTVNSPAEVSAVFDNISYDKGILSIIFCTLSFSAVTFFYCCSRLRFTNDYACYGNGNIFQGTALLSGRNVREILFKKKKLIV